MLLLSPRSSSCLSELHTLWLACFSVQRFLFSRVPFFSLITAKEYLRTQRNSQGPCQWHQEGQENQVCLYTGNGPQVSEKPEICQEIQRF